MSIFGESRRVPSEQSELEKTFLLDPILDKEVSEIARGIIDVPEALAPTKDNFGLIDILIQYYTDALKSANKNKSYKQITPHTYQDSLNGLQAVRSRMESQSFDKALRRAPKKWLLIQRLKKIIPRVVAAIKGEKFKSYTTPPESQSENSDELDRLR